MLIVHEPVVSCNSHLITPWCLDCMSLLSSATASLQAFHAQLYMSLFSTATVSLQVFHAECACACCQLQQPCYNRLMLNVHGPTANCNSQHATASYWALHAPVVKTAGRMHPLNNQCRTCTVLHCLCWTRTEWGLTSMPHWHITDYKQIRVQVNLCSSTCFYMLTEFPV